ncbi:MULTISPECIES: hypothetical protein [unclassified Kitasatospora]|uniref:hypothetical protein n=1 Tax=unclassified Kitasatospora TaxID=2633591 RepID=UPI00070F5027|nr:MULTISPECIES: hypothetical protein [unclassified Kitasatospora]KQV10109.1 hypothetical protein ASC99_36350 [Kitasatospora sp. Root107]KRB66412.1 hypothetical protein ASE03_30795 [Kitasatospora sp. Root187]
MTGPHHDDEPPEHRRYAQYLQALESVAEADEANLLAAVLRDDCVSMAESAVNHHLERIEVRASTDPALHDRCIIGDDQQVQLLGSSVTGVGKHLTAVISPPGDIAQAYRQKYEKIWRDAQQINPQNVSTPPAQPT